jgi:hypothetical protein
MLTTIGTSISSPGRLTLPDAWPVPFTSRRDARSVKLPTAAPGNEKLPSTPVDVTSEGRPPPLGDCWLIETVQPLRGSSVPACNTVPRTTASSSRRTLTLTSWPLKKIVAVPAPRCAEAASNTSTRTGPSGM